MTGTNHPFRIDVPVEIIEPRDADGAPCLADGSVVVALHGMGQSAASFVKDVAPLLPPGTTGILPQGPYPYEMRSSSGIRQGNAWYVYTGENEAFLASMAKTEAWLLGVIDAEISRLGLAGGRSRPVREAGDDSVVEFREGTPGGSSGDVRRVPQDDASGGASGNEARGRRVALLGFSQGGYLAGFVGVRNAPRFRALVVAAGRIKDESLEDAARAAGSLPVLHVHGEQDESVKPGPSRASVERLASWGVPAEFRGYACGHSVLRDERCRDDVRAFLASRLAADV